MKTKIVKPLLSLGLTMAFFASTVLALDIPSDVENLIGVPGDGKVTLKWDAAVSKTPIEKYVVFQGLSSVTNEEGKYSKRYDVGNKTSYEVVNLQNGINYYFTVVAFDEKGNHSENYSNEVIVKPIGGVESPKTVTTVAPKVSRAETLNNEEIKLTFSKEIVLPRQTPEKAFVIKENISQVKLEVITVKMDISDAKSVILSTQKQKSNMEYIITATSDIVDKENNPIVSGTADTAYFVGSTKNKEVVLSPTANPSTTPTPSSTPKETVTPSSTPTATPTSTPTPTAKVSPPVINLDIEAPTIKKAEPKTNDKIEITFSEEVVLKGENPALNFEISEKANNSNKIKVKKAYLKEGDLKTIILETDLTKANTEYVVTILEIKDKAGNSIATTLNQNKITYVSKEMQLKDVLPPEEVTNFAAQIISNIVKLTWTASVNTAKDLVDQILYQSMDDGKTYKKVKNLGPALTSYTLKNLKEGITYTFKLTVKDAVGNESTGVITTVSLPATGASLAVSIIGTIAALAAYHRRRSK